MAKILIQFDDDKPVEVTEIENNQQFNLLLSKTDISIGKVMTTKQQSQCHEFTDGKKRFKIYIK